jgi:hypothetical protein
MPCDVANRSTVAMKAFAYLSRMPQPHLDVRFPPLILDSSGCSVAYHRTCSLSRDATGSCTNKPE